MQGLFIKIPRIGLAPSKNQLPMKKLHLVLV